MTAATGAPIGRCAEPRLTIQTGMAGAAPSTGYSRRIIVAPAMDKLVFSSNEASGFLGVSRSAAYAAAKSGHLATGIRVIHVGSRMVVPRIDLESVLGPLPGFDPVTR